MNVAALLVLMLFVYAVVGVFLFGTVRLNNPGALNHNMNFKDFPHAMLMLFR